MIRQSGVFILRDVHPLGGSIGQARIFQATPNNLDLPFGISPYLWNAMEISPLIIIDRLIDDKSVF